jgi:hypothetical protein
MGGQSHADDYQGLTDAEWCVPRTQRSAPLFAAWCAAEPGP